MGLFAQNYEMPVFTADGTTFTIGDVVVPPATSAHTHCHYINTKLYDSKPSAKSKPTEKSLKPKHVIYNNPATIVIWEDGTKTVVKCAEDVEYDKYVGFCAAVAKRVFGNNNKVRKAAGLPKEKRVVADVVSDADTVSDVDIVSDADTVSDGDAE